MKGHPEADAPSGLGGSLARSGLIVPGEAVRFTPLTGGVSSDILLVETPSRRFCVKRALAKLKVAADWRAPVERNHAEAEWMRVAASIVPHAVPEVLAEDQAAGFFAMAYLPPERHPVWKAELRDGVIEPAIAAEVGARMAAIHASTAGSAALAARFANDHIFYSIRLEAYLVATAARHPGFAARLDALVETTRQTKLALVHGDVSPKNILVGPHGPVFLDAECAWYGDPAFDLAFCLNHMLLKCVWRPQWTRAYLECFAALADAYLTRVTWETTDALEARAARLLPALFLARVDGKSPVEYITRDEDRARVRDAAMPLIATPPDRLGQVARAWEKEMKR